MKNSFLRNVLLAVALSFPVAFYSCDDDDDDDIIDNEVTIDNDAYSPSTITITKGETVKWTNEEAELHTVTSDTDLFDSGDMEENDTYSRTFNTTGSFPYHCDHHSNMHGTVIVED